jgi:hypothetical protein
MMLRRNGWWQAAQQRRTRALEEQLACLMQEHGTQIRSVASVLCDVGLPEAAAAISQSYSSSDSPSASASPSPRSDSESESVVAASGGGGGGGGGDGTTSTPPPPSPPEMGGVACPAPCSAAGSGGEAGEAGGEAAGGSGGQDAVMLTLEQHELLVSEAVQQALALARHKTSAWVGHVHTLRSAEKAAIQSERR